jgi:thioredoxin 1
MPRVIHVDKEDAYLNQIGNKEGGLTVVDFSAAWCGPCKRITPHYESLSDKYPKVTFMHVDIDELPNLPDVMSVRAVPTFMYFVNGRKVAEVAGANIDAVERLLKQHSS